MTQAEYACKRCGVVLTESGGARWDTFERLRLKVNAHVCPDLADARNRFFAALNMQSTGDEPV